MRRRQAYAQQVDSEMDEIERQYRPAIRSIADQFAAAIEANVMRGLVEQKCPKCGRVMKSDHGLKIHSARCRA